MAAREFKESMKKRDSQPLEYQPED
jgi:hypothetical protein